MTREEGGVEGEKFIFRTMKPANIASLHSPGCLLLSLVGPCLQCSAGRFPQGEMAPSSPLVSLMPSEQVKGPNSPAACPPSAVTPFANWFDHRWQLGHLKAQSQAPTVAPQQDILDSLRNNGPARLPPPAPRSCVACQDWLLREAWRVLRGQGFW